MADKSLDIAVRDDEIHVLIDYFESLLGERCIQRIVAANTTTSAEHFWRRYIVTYRHWIRNGSHTSDITSNNLLLQFGTIVRSIQVFEPSKLKRKAHRQFLKRLRSSQKVDSLLFELRTGIHYRINGLPIRWVANIGHRPSDLVIVLGRRKKVLIECTHRKTAIRRIIWDESAVMDLLKSAEKKLKSSFNWNWPRIVTIKIPEYIDWTNNNITSQIDIAVNKWLIQGRLKNVNALVFMGEEKFIRTKRMVVPDQTVYLIRNKFAKHNLPSEVDRLLINK